MLLCDADHVSICPSVWLPLDPLTSPFASATPNTAPHNEWTLNIVHLCFPSSQFCLLLHFKLEFTVFDDGLNNHGVPLRTFYYVNRSNIMQIRFRMFLIWRNYRVNNYMGCVCHDTMRFALMVHDLLCVYFLYSLFKAE